MKSGMIFSFINYLLFLLYIITKPINYIRLEVLIIYNVILFDISVVLISINYDKYFIKGYLVSIERSHI